MNEEENLQQKSQKKTNIPLLEEALKKFPELDYLATVENLKSLNSAINTNEKIKLFINSLQEENFKQQIIALIKHKNFSSIANLFHSKGEKLIDLMIANDDKYGQFINLINSKKFSSIANLFQGRGEKLIDLMIANDDKYGQFIKLLNGENFSSVANLFQGRGEKLIDLMIANDDKYGQFIKLLNGENFSSVANLFHSKGEKLIDLMVANDDKYGQFIKLLNGKNFFSVANLFKGKGEKLIRLLEDDKDALCGIQNLIIYLKQQKYTSNCRGRGLQYIEHTIDGKMRLTKDFTSVTNSILENKKQKKELYDEDREDFVTLVKKKARSNSQKNKNKTLNKVSKEDIPVVIDDFLDNQVKKDEIINEFFIENPEQKDRFQDTLYEIMEIEEKQDFKEFLLNASNVIRNKEEMITADLSLVQLFASFVEHEKANDKKKAPKKKSELKEEKRKSKKIETENIYNESEDFFAPQSISYLKVGGPSKKVKNEELYSNSYPQEMQNSMNLENDSFWGQFQQDSR